MKVDFTHRARRDLNALRHWISADRPRAAMKMVDRIVDPALSLDRLAMRYPVVADPDIRRMPVGPYLIFYRVTDQVQVLHIMYSARDWPNLLDDPA